MEMTKSIAKNSNPKPKENRASMVDSVESEDYPEGYSEALAQCTVLAARLLKMMTKSSVNNQTETF